MLDDSKTSDDSKISDDPNMLNNSFKVSLKMHSDWHIGIGAGVPGSVDKLINTDLEGLPQIPAKTLVGIWRDALESLTDGLDGGKGRRWHKQVERIFGNQPNVEKDPFKKPVPAIISPAPARLAKNLRSKISRDPKLKQALTFVKVGVTIDPISGTAKSENLRFEQMGRSGTVLESEIELAVNHELTTALLILSAKFVKRIGGKRRRGAGKCELVIQGLPDHAEQWAVKCLRKYEDGTVAFPGLAAPASENPAVAEESSIDSANLPELAGTDGEWQVFEYSLALETPVSIVTAVLGNVSETLDFIPGTYLVSHFVKTYGTEIFDAVQKGDFQISPATISINGRRSRFVPKIFDQEKMGARQVINRLLGQECENQTKPIRSGFVGIDENLTIFHASTPKTVLMHSAVDDQAQRPTAEVVGVYSREAIRAGTLLKGEIRFRNVKFTPSNENAKIRLGTSKKDDYGLARLSISAPPSAGSEISARLPANSTTAQQNDLLTKEGRLVIYLASDVLLRNGNLRPTNLASDLLKALNLKQQPAEKPDFQQIRVRRIESWNVSWGFSRSTLVALEAGSVISYKFDPVPEQAELDDMKIALEKIQARGIGERCGEGYGRIEFNPAFLTQTEIKWKHLKDPKFEELGEADENENQISPDPAVAEFERIVEEAAWRNEIKLAVAKIADRPEKRADIFGFKVIQQNNENRSIPPLSQIGGLRSAVSRLQKIEDGAGVVSWLNHLSGTDNRIEKWDQNKNKRQAKELVTKIKSLFEDVEKVWEILEGKTVESIVCTFPKTLNQDPAVLKKKLWAEAVRELFYACQHAHKRETEKEKPSNG